MPEATIGVWYSLVAALRTRHQPPEVRWIVRGSVHRRVFTVSGSALPSEERIQVATAAFATRGYRLERKSRSAVVPGWLAEPVPAMTLTFVRDAVAHRAG